MEQQKIKYIDIRLLGFNESAQDDSVYFDQYGFHYSIITKKLTKRIYLDWAKETQLCKMVRVDKKHNIKAEAPIMDLEHLKLVINFFTDKKTETT